jgi:hypothetical protein
VSKVQAAEAKDADPPLVKLEALMAEKQEQPAKSDGKAKSVAFLLNMEDLRSASLSSSALGVVLGCPPSSRRRLVAMQSGERASMGGAQSPTRLARAGASHIGDELTSQHTVPSRSACT